jgi:hypothetical protein
MTNEEIMDVASPFLEWTEQGYAVIDKVGFARAIESRVLAEARRTVSGHSYSAGFLDGAKEKCPNCGFGRGAEI